VINMNKVFWRGKNVLVTGHEGFLGSWLSKTLLDSGACVFGIDINTNRKDTIFTPEDYRQISSLTESVAAYDPVETFIQAGKIDYVFHLAAEALVEDCVREPLRCFTSNIEGTWTVLEVCRHCPSIKGVVVASTDKAYGVHEELPYVETAPLRADAPYDVSKSCADMVAHAYYATYRLPVAVTRCGNIYGPGDFNFSRIIPDTIRSIINSEVLQIRSDGQFVRDYVYVKDIVDGYMTLAEALEKPAVAGEAFNFSDEKPLTVLALVEKIYDLMGAAPNYQVLNRAKNEIPSQYLCSAKAKERLRWEPQYSAEKALTETIAWYTQHFQNAKGEGI
jgi:CDP-glucose 4,6-dehydratase